MTARKRRGAPQTDGPTALGFFAGGLLQASYLVALAVVPLFFNPRTERVFEPDKLAWVLVCGLFALWAHAVGWAEVPVLRRGRPGPIGLAAGLAMAALLLGGLASVVPLVSWWGLYRRGLGIVVYLAMFALFGAVALTADRADATARLRRVLVTVLVPLSLYALLQRVGVDTIVWDADAAAPTYRPFGALGNPIFLGAYVIMVLPVALAEVLLALERRGRGEPGAAAHLTGATVAGVLGLSALVLTQSRGPALGLLVGIGVFALLWAAAAGRARLAVGTGAVGLAGLAGLFALTRIGGESLGRLGGLLSLGSRTAQERLFVWEALGDLVAADPLRALIGYGPETQAYVLPPHLPEALVRLAPGQVFDRAHNIVWEWWLSAGLLGLVALLLLYLAAFGTALWLLGLLRDRRDASRLVALSVGGTALGALLPTLVGVAALTALGAPLGFLAGVCVFALMAAWGAPDRGVASAPRARTLTTLAVSAGLAAHLVEGALGLPTAAGELLFWVYLGVLAALARGARHGDPGPAVVQARAGEGADGGGPIAADGLLDGLVLSAVVFAPLLVAFTADPMAEPLLWSLPLATWIVADLIGGPAGRPAWRRPGARLVVILAMVLFQALLGGRVGGQAVAFAALLVVVTPAVGWFLADAPRGAPAGAPWRWFVYAALGALAIVGAWRLAVQPIVADAHVRAGLVDIATGDIGRARERFERAATLWPQQPALATYLSAIHHERMRDTTASGDQRQQAYEQGVSILSGAYDRVPDPAFLERLSALYRDRGDIEPHPSTQRDLWRQARQVLELAFERAPLRPEALGEYGVLLERQGEMLAARRAYERAIDLAGGSPYWLSGVARAALATGDIEGAEAVLRRALDEAGDAEQVGAALTAADRLPIDALPTRQSEIMVLALVQRVPEARALLDALQAQVPGDPVSAALGDWLDGIAGE